MANITETCDPENDLQLVTKVQVAPNNIDDTQLLAEALPELKERTDLDTLYTVGGYGSPEMERKSTRADPFLSFLMDVVRNFLATFAFYNRVFGF